MITVQISQEFYDKNQVCDGLETIASHIRKGATHWYAPSWKLIAQED